MFKNIKIIQPILAVLLIFIPLYPKFPLFNVNNTYVAIRLDDIVLALAFLVWLIYQIKNKFTFFKQPITKLFIAYFVAITLSFINAFFIYQTEPTNILFLNLFRRFEYISVFFITLDAIKNMADLKFAYVSFLIGTFFVDLYGLGQKFLQFPVISTMNSEFSKGQLLQMNIWTRINSTFAGHYDLAAFLSVALIIITGVGLVTKSKITKLFSLIVWLPSFYILTQTASRVSIFAFWGGAIIALLFIKKYLWIIPISGLVIFSIFNSKDLNQRLLATIPALKIQINKSQNQTTPTPTAIITQTPIPTKIVGSNVNKLTPTPTIVRHQLVDEYPPVDTDVGVARSGEIRFNAEWPRAITAFKRNIVTGSGLGSITLATDNDYLRALGESGLLGFVSFGSIIVFFFIKTLSFVFAKNKTYQQKISLIFFGGLLAMLANAIFIDVFEASKTAYLFWIMLGLYYQSLSLKK